MGEEREKKHPEADYVKQQDEGDDVEAHKYAAAEDKYAATEEPPDVEGHRLPPKHKP